jgi:hypothetical protein
MIESRNDYQLETLIFRLAGCFKCNALKLTSEIVQLRSSAYTCESDTFLHRFLFTNGTLTNEQYEEIHVRTLARKRDRIKV